MQSVFVLQHAYERDGCEEYKFIGVYSARSLAEQAVERLRQRPGFREHPDDFTIGEYVLDRDHWTDGFFAAALILVPHRDSPELTQAQAELLPGGVYRITSASATSALWRFQPGDVVRCRAYSNEDETLVAYEAVSEDP